MDQELAKTRDHLQKEATERCQYLAEELSGHLRCTKEGIGEGAVDRSTRSKVSVEMEMRRATVLKNHNPWSPFILQARGRREKSCGISRPVQEDSRKNG